MPTSMKSMRFASRAEHAWAHWVLGVALVLYLSFALNGIQYGLHPNGHLLSYDPDESTWLEALSGIRPGKLNPAPELYNPTFYLEMYAAVVGVAVGLKWIPFHQTKEWFRTHPEVFARFYLAGRFIQVACGILLLILMWEFASRLWNRRVADLSVLFMSITPSLVATSHFSQASLPVTLLAFVALACFLRDEQYQRVRPGWLLLGSFFTGLAISTKYSAFPLLAVMGYQLRSRLGESKIFCSAIFILVSGFFLGTPFALLQPRVFIHAFHALSNDTLRPVPSGWASKLSFPFCLPFYHAMGLALEVFCVAGWVWDMIRARGKSGVGIWILAFYLGTLAAGNYASPARVLIALPAFVILAARFTDWIMSHDLNLGRAAAAMTVCATVLPTLAIASLHNYHHPQAQLTTSHWIEDHIPLDKTIGIPRSIYWWTPDVIYSSSHHPERMAHPYHVIDLHYSKDVAEQLKPDYILLSGAERTNENLLFNPNGPAFLEWLDSGKDYHRIMFFPRLVGFGRWRWNRPERPFYTDDDLWLCSMEIFERVSLRH